MFFRVKQGDILSRPTTLDGVKMLIGYAKEGGNPLFAVLEHGGVVSLATSQDPDFQDILDLLGE